MLKMILFLFFFHDFNMIKFMTWIFCFLMKKYDLDLMFFSCWHFYFIFNCFVFVFLLSLFDSL